MVLPLDHDFIPLMTRRRAGRLAAAAFVLILATLTRVDGVAAQDTTHATNTDTSRTGVRRWFRLDHFGLALGPSINFRRMGLTNTERVAPGIAGGFFLGSGAHHRSRSGLIPAFKIDIFPKRLAAIDTLGGTTSTLGTIKTRSVMAGLGWTQPFGPLISGVVTGVIGRSFNYLGDAAQAGHSPAFQVVSSPASISNSAAWELSGRLWYQFRPNTSVIGGISYYQTRPELTFADGSERRSNFDNLRADVGVAFTIFRR